VILLTGRRGHGGEEQNNLRKNKQFSSLLFREIQHESIKVMTIFFTLGKVDQSLVSSVTLTANQVVILVMVF
jgi:hypothetical protein